MNNLSLLLGAGFSRTAGYPLASELNGLITSIRADDLFYHSDGTYLLLKYIGNDPNAHLSIQERIFFEKMIVFFSEKLNPFKYEDFIDAYSSLRSDPTKYEFETFYKSEFKAEREELLGFNMTQDLKKFNSALMQIIVQELTKEFESIHRANWPGYEGFLNYIASVADQQNVFVHTLNHDILFEQFNNTNVVNHRISDGFSELGSTFYADIRGIGKVRTKYFTDTFNTPIQLFKMHGSIDAIPFHFQRQDGSIDRTMIKLHRKAPIYNYYKEYTKPNGELDYFHDFFNYFSEILTGTKEKIRRYEGEHYFKQVFEHFQANMESSDKLLVIGYGGQDEVINQYVIDFFLKNPTKKLLYVNPNRPATVLLESPNTRYLACGVSDLNPNLMEDEFAAIQVSNN